MFRDQTQGLGTITWWGLSPALDFLKQKNIDRLQHNEGETINILSVGAADFFIIENNIELVARQTVQLYLMSRPNCELGIQDKTELFLELYGNSLVRDFTESWLEESARIFVEFVTNEASLSRFRPLLNYKTLKFKERDLLECIFKMWRKKTLKEYNISTYWDSRVRQHLGTRYDAIPNVFDWDCSITLHDRGVKTMESREYGKWRRSGVAFTPRQASYLACNRTLASGRTFSSASGDRNALIGYWGDIICSPYLAFGTDTSQCPELGRFTHGVKLWGGALISEVNVRRLLWQVVHGKPCPRSIASSPYSGTPDANSQDAKGEGCETIEEEAEEEKDETKSEKEEEEEEKDEMKSEEEEEEEEKGHNLDGIQSEEEKKGEDSKNNKEKEDHIAQSDVDGEKLDGQNELQNKQSAGCTSSTEATSEASMTQQNDEADGATEENVVPAGDPNMEDASGSGEFSKDGGAEEDETSKTNGLPVSQKNSREVNGEGNLEDARNLCELFEVHFLPTNSFPELSVRMASHFAEPEQKISLIYIACSMLHLLASPDLRPPKEVISQSNGPEGEFHNAGLVGLTTPRCQLIIESVLYIVDLRPNQVEAYVKRATEMAADVGFKVSGAGGA
nr:unnamed protein product [Spirometra erinaceieuropaei]